MNDQPLPFRISLRPRGGGRVALVLLVTWAMACAEPPVPDTPEALYARGERVYAARCLSCHGGDGQGQGGVYPPLADTDWVVGDAGRLVRLVHGGMVGPITVNGVTYDGAMPPYDYLSDADLAAVLTFIRQSFGNEAAPITAADVASVRASYDHRGFWTAETLREQTGLAAPPNREGSAVDAEEGAGGSAPASPAVADRRGADVYQTYCGACHQVSGAGVPGLFPPLTGTDWVLGDEGRLIRLVLDGMSGPIEVDGVAYNNVMPAHDRLSDQQIADVLTFVRQSFGNDAPPVTPDQVAAVRAADEQRGPWSPDALRAATGIPAAE